MHPKIKKEKTKTKTKKILDGARCCRGGERLRRGSRSRRRASPGSPPPPPRLPRRLAAAAAPLPTFVPQPPRCSLRGGARLRAAPPCRQLAAQLAGRRLCLSGSRGKERGSRGKQRREKTGKGNGEREAPGEKARGDIITCLWGRGVDREEAFIRSTAKTVLRASI